MKNIGIIYGGKSVEHDISIITAMQVVKGVKKDFNLMLIYITPNGEMVTAKNLDDPNIYLNFDKLVKDKRKVAFLNGSDKIIVLKGKKIAKYVKIDCFLLCNHGHGGEDGTLQGEIEMTEIPYTSCGVSSSAICMDKVLTKIMLASDNILSPEYIYFDKSEYSEKKDTILKKIKFPCIVKPARLGSSVGIGLCEKQNDIEKLIENAFEFDNKVIIEKYIANAREFCVAVLKNAEKTITSKVTEVKKGKFFTFEEKYLTIDEKEKRTISRKLETKLKKVAEKVYLLLECNGVVRIDFLYDENSDELFVNEVNSIPGSLSFNMFDFNVSDLVKTLINEGIKRKEEENKNVYKFSSSAIEKYIQMQEKIGTKK